MKLFMNKANSVLHGLNKNRSVDFSFSVPFNFLFVIVHRLNLIVLLCNTRYNQCIVIPIALTKVIRTRHD